MTEGTGKLRQAEQDRESRIGRTGRTKQERKNRPCSKALHDKQDRIV
jgi:hypothetical protein